MGEREADGMDGLPASSNRIMHGMLRLFPIPGWFAPP